MTSKLDKIHEMYKLLNEKERVNHDIMSTFGRFGLSQTLRRLGLEKQQGVSALQLIISLCLFRFNGESIFGMYRKDFHSLVETGKNCYYLYNEMKIIILTILFALATITADAQFLFRISGNGLKEPSYILGTIHTLPASVKLDSIPEYIEAESKCRQLYAEVDTGATKLVADALTAGKLNMFLPEGETIGDLLTQEQFTLLKSKVKELTNKNLSRRNNLKPINFLIIFNRAIEAEAMKKYCGGNETFTRIDMDCIDRAVKRGMTLGHLDEYARIDSMPDRMGLGMEIDAQVDSLVHFLNNFDENHQKALDLWKALTEWIDYWTKGDFDSFASMEGWDELLALNPGDVLSRNEKWLPVIKNAMSESPTMFVFGAAHLVGKEGLLEKLHEAGYKVKQVKSKRK